VRAFSRIGSPSKAAQIPEEGNGSLERSRRQDGGARESKICDWSASNPSHGTKMLGKTPLAKKAHKKSLMSKSKI
jgi:hypothetical protein